MFDIVVPGFPLVEIMRKKRGISFYETGDFTGPYPSADTCILLDIALRLGMKTCLLGTAGTDIFADVVLDRLEKDGVNISYVRRVPGVGTGLVFVRYEDDGTREYHDVNAGTAMCYFEENDVDEDLISKARWIHFSGEVIGLCREDKQRQALLKSLKAVSKDAKVSLDPNCAESESDLYDLFYPFIARADLVLPSEGEACFLVPGVRTEQEAIERLVRKGKIVAYKKGKAGSVIYSGSGAFNIKAYPITEVDPTGSGDAYCAGLASALLSGKPLEEAGKVASACGALMAGRFGPMEFSYTMADVEEMIRMNA